MSCFRSSKRAAWDSCGENVVLIHEFTRAKQTPNPSPFPIKLETYCRMAGIKYKIDSKDPFSKKGKTPWITLNGMDLADSQFCIEHLNKEFSVDLNKNLTPEEQAIAHSLRVMTEEHLLWCLALWRFSQDKSKGFFKVWDAPIMVKLALPLLKRKLVNRSKAQGIGLHSKDEIIQIGIAELKTLSDFLGKKKYLMGDEPCEVDCTVFGFLVQMIWNTPGSPYEAMINNELTNLKSYANRIKGRYWPDWDELQKPGNVDFTQLVLK